MQSTSSPSTTGANQKPGAVDKFFEIVYWFRIMISPLIVGCILGFVAYIYFGGVKGIIAGSVVALAGLIVGIVWATRMMRKHGAINFYSRVNAVKELRTDD